MSTSTKDAAEPVQPLDEPSIMPLPIQREHKTRINHPQPSWWPQSAAKRLALGKRVRDNIVSVAAQLEYNVDNNTVSHITSCVTAIEKLENYRAAVDAHSQGYTENLDFAYNGPANENQLVIKIDTNATATLGPTTANLNLFGGLLGWLMALEYTLNQIPAYRADQQFGITLGFIKDAAMTANFHEESFTINGDKLVDNQPAVIWKKGANDAATFLYKELSEDDAHYHGAGTFLSSPSVLAIPHFSTARVVQVIGSYVKGNQRVGTWSAPHQLTIPAILVQTA